MSHNDQIQQVLSQFQVWFEDAVQLIAEVKPGERLPVTVLSEQVAAKHGMKGSQIYPVLRFFFEAYSVPGVKRQKGAHGGYVREVVSDKESK